MMTILCEHIHNRTHEHDRGFVALGMVVVISFVMLLSVVSVSRQTLASADMVRGYDTFRSARLAAFSCAHIFRARIVQGYEPLLGDSAAYHLPTLTNAGFETAWCDVSVTEQSTFAIGARIVSTVTDYVGDTSRSAWEIRFEMPRANITRASPVPL